MFLTQFPLVYWIDGAARRLQGVHTPFKADSTSEYGRDTPAMMLHRCVSWGIATTYT
jgi:hypothetical protein